MQQKLRSTALLLSAVALLASGDLAYAKRPADATSNKAMPTGESVQSHNERQKTPHSQRKESALRLKAAFTAARNRQLAKQGGQPKTTGAK